MDRPSRSAKPPTGQGDRDTTTEGALTLATYFAAFGRAPAWEELPAWPPDVFCLCNLLLDHSEAYRFAVAPPSGRHWPPAPDWNAGIATAARAWRDACAGAAPGSNEIVLPAGLPGLLTRHWSVVTAARDLPVSQVASGEAWKVCESLLTLHALADEACASLEATEPPSLPDAMERRAWALLSRGSLSRVSPRRVRIVPKTNLTLRGITIRSMSRYLALFYESVDVRWKRVESEPARVTPPVRQRGYNVLLVPWPLEVHASDFRPVPGPLENMDPDLFGFFEFAPRQRLDCARVRDLLGAAQSRVGQVDAVVLPESAVTADEVTLLEDALREFGATFLVAGVRQPASEEQFGRNYLHFGVWTGDGWARYQQDKHHRWCLDGNQIRQYHLSRSLDARKLWWEAIDIRSRAIHVIDVGGGTTAAPLVCEDLARMDEVNDLLRRIAPSLVLAVLLDGPQLVSRWPCRYASVLADEPGSTVLTVTSFGMVRRSRPPGLPPSRAIALWNDSQHGVKEIQLGVGAGAVLLETSLEGKTLWTADGRRHTGVPDLVLSGTRQVRL